MEAQDELQKSRHHVTNSVAWLLLRLIGGILLIETAYLLFIVLALTPFASQFHLEVTAGLWVLHTVQFLLVVALVLALVVPWGSTHYYLTDTQLIKYIGLTRRDETVFDLESLKSVELHQGWFGRLLNYGDIRVVLAASGFQQELVMVGVYNPKKCERALRQSLTNTSHP